MGTKRTSDSLRGSQTLFCVHFGKDSISFPDCLFQCVKCPLLQLTIHTFLYPELAAMMLDTLHINSMGLNAIH